MVANGSIVDTSALGDDSPNSKYFTGSIWPAFKNHGAIIGAADNAYYELITSPPIPQYNLTIITVQIITTDITGTVGINIQFGYHTGYLNPRCAGCF